MNGNVQPSRRCLACGALEPVLGNEPVWPLGWRCRACGHVVEQSADISMFAPELADTVSGMDPKNFETLAKFEAEHFWFVVRNELIGGLINKYFPDARRFLEIGCGNGAVLRYIAGLRTWWVPNCTRPGWRSRENDCHRR